MNRRAARLLTALAALAPLAAAPALAFPDFHAFVPGGWADHIVALPTASATAGSVPLPTTLPGGVPCYVSASVIQGGLTASPTNTAWSWRLDGAEFAAFGLGAWNPSVYAWANNVPVVVRGGRHTLEQVSDPAGLVAESNEGNNDAARQFYWTPPEVPAGSLSLRPAPPDRTGGWSGLPAGMLRTIDTDSYRLPLGTGAPGDGPWQIVAVHVPTRDADVDLQVFAAGANASDVFATPVASSQYADDETDYVVVNRAAHGPAPLDVAAVNSGGASPYALERRGSGAVIGFGNAWIEDSLAASQAVAIHTFHVDASPSPISIEVARDGTSRLAFEVFLPNQTVVGRGSGILAPTLNPTDHAQRSVVGNMAPGDYALVVYRTGNGTFDPLHYRVRVRPAPGELRPVVPAGWAASIVPRRTGSPDIIGSSVTPLEGWTPTTNVVLALFNDFYVTARPVVLGATIDGALFTTGAVDSLPGQQGLAMVGDGFVIRGGRHTLGVWTDPSDLIAEFNEADNQDARQWTWSGFPLVNDVSDVRPVPADRFAGHDAIPADSVRTANVDGYRTPLYRAGRSDGFWGAVSVVPLNMATDLDVFAYATSTSPRDGFVHSLRSSVNPYGQADILLFDVQDTGSRSLDVGVENWDGSAAFRMQSSISHYDAGGAGNRFGTYTLPAGQVVSVIEAPPGPAGSVTWRLRNLDGTTDLALALVPRNDASGNYSLSDEYTAGRVANAHGSGEDEFLTAPMPSDYYALVVFRPNANAAQQGLARFTITTSGPGTTDAGDAAPTSIAFVGASPNPVRERATLSFELPSARRVELAVYDVAGQRVTTLASGTWAAGRHAVAWDGRADDGRALAAGLYFARLDAGEFHGTRKVTLVK